MDRLITLKAQMFRIEVRALLCEEAAVYKTRKFTAFQPKWRYNTFLYKQLLGVWHRISNLLMSI
jgi:hypothetical protein